MWWRGVVAAGARLRRCGMGIGRRLRICRIVTLVHGADVVRSSDRAGHGKMAGRMINGAAALAGLVRAAGETDEGGVHRVLPVAPELSGLLPGRGLRRGSTVAVATGAASAGGGTSLLLALLAEASRSGSWCAVVGVPSLGALAAAESGLALERLALVPNPGPEWPTVVAALIDGVDLVVMAVPGAISASIASRLVARARQRGSVLVPFGDWAGADVTLQVTAGRWEGLGTGHGRLRRREVTVLARGRGAAARPKEVTMWMPGVTVRPITLPPAPAATDPETTPSVPASDLAGSSPSASVSALAGSTPLASALTPTESTPPVPASASAGASVPGGVPASAGAARAIVGLADSDGPAAEEEDEFGQVLLFRRVASRAPSAEAGGEGEPAMPHGGPPGRREGLVEGGGRRRAGVSAAVM